MLDGKTRSVIQRASRLNSPGHEVELIQAALFDSMTIGQNVAFPLRRHTRMPDEEIRARAQDLLAQALRNEEVVFAPAEMVDREVASFLPKDQQVKLRRVDEARTKGVSGRYELGFLHRNGTRRTLLVSGGPRLQGTEFGGTLANTDVAPLTLWGAELQFGTPGIATTQSGQRGQAGFAL